MRIVRTLGAYTRGMTTKRATTKKASGKPKKVAATAAPKPKGLAAVFGILTEGEADKLAAHVSKLRGRPILSK